MIDAADAEADAAARDLIDSAAEPAEPLLRALVVVVDDRIAEDGDDAAVNHDLAGVEAIVDAGKQLALQGYAEPFDNFVDIGLAHVAQDRRDILELNGQNVSDRQWSPPESPPERSVEADRTVE